MHIQRHTHTSTHVQSAHKRHGDNRHRSLVERGGRKALLEILHTPKTKMTGKSDIHESKGKDSST